MKVRTAVMGAAVCLLGAGLVGADVWDFQTENDNTVDGTRNELVHGTYQIHDLAGTADNDYFIIGQKPNSSYEVVVDSGSGDFGLFGPTVERVTSDGSTTLTVSQSISPGRDYARSLRWANTNDFTVNNEYVRIRSSGCSSGCDGNDTYHVRAYDTTVSLARFNNSGTQVTVLILKNTTVYGIDGVIYYWSIGGSILASETFHLDSNFMLVIQTSNTVPGVGGSITIAHDARYGDLKGKAVALEPSTGFAFDTLMEAKPR